MNTLVIPILSNSSGSPDFPEFPDSPNSSDSPASADSSDFPDSSDSSDSTDSPDSQDSSNSPDPSDFPDSSDSPDPQDSPVIEEIDFAKHIGIDSASSTREGNEPSRAFLKIGNGWMAHKTDLPAFIWRAFSNHTVRASRISFLPRQGSKFDNNRIRMPSKYKFIGSNDRSCRIRSNWVVLCQDLSGARITQSDEPRGCEVKEVHRNKSFRCVGLKILQTGGRANARTPALREIRMWEVLD